MTRIMALAAGALALACAAPPPEVRPGGGDPATVPRPSATAPASSPASDPPQPITDEAPAMEARFLPHEASCATDADCAVTRYGAGPSLFCCDGCDSVAGTKRWVARADELCAAYHAGSAQHHPCPPRDCGPRAPARCQQGRCL